MKKRDMFAMKEKDLKLKKKKKKKKKFPCQ